MYWMYILCDLNTANRMIEYFHMFLMELQRLLKKEEIALINSINAIKQNNVDIK